MDFDGDGIDEEQEDGQLPYFPPMMGQVPGYGQHGAQPQGPPRGIGFPRGQFPPGYAATMNRMRAPPPPRPGMPGPIQFGQGDSPIPAQPDPRVMQQIQEKETALQMIAGRDDVGSYQKELAKARLNAEMDQIDPRGQYRQGSPLRSQSKVEQAFGQGVMQDPRHPDLYWHLDSHGAVKSFQYKGEKSLPATAQDFGAHVMAHTGMPLEQWHALGKGFAMDPHTGALKPFDIKNRRDYDIEYQIKRDELQHKHEAHEADMDDKADDRWLKAHEHAVNSAVKELAAKGWTPAYIAKHPEKWDEHYKDHVAWHLNQTGLAGSLEEHRQARQAERKAGRQSQSAPGTVAPETPPPETSPSAPTESPTPAGAAPPVPPKLPTTIDEVKETMPGSRPAAVGLGKRYNDALRRFNTSGGKDVAAQAEMVQLIQQMQAARGG